MHLYFVNVSTHIFSVNQKMSISSSLALLVGLLANYQRHWMVLSRLHYHTDITIVEDLLSVCGTYWFPEIFHSPHPELRFQVSRLQIFKNLQGFCLCPKVAFYCQFVLVKFVQPSTMYSCESKQRKLNVIGLQSLEKGFAVGWGRS